MDYGDSEDVQKVHAAIQREKQEPRVGLEPLSLWLIGIYALAIFFGGAYLGRFSGSFSGDSLDPGTIPTKSHGAGPGGGGQQQTAAGAYPRRARQKSFLGELRRVPSSERTRIAKSGLSATCRF